MIKLELSDKMMRFLIEAVDYRVAAHSAEIGSRQLSEDDSADASNDRALLMSLNRELRRLEKEFNDAQPSPGDARSRAKLKLIMQCLYNDGFSEAEQDALIKMGSQASPDPAWTDYLYWPNKFGLDGSIDAALDRAFSYRPIHL